MDKLALIISQPRSGSTLLNNLLQNHPKIIGGEEFWLLLPLLSLYKPNLTKASFNSSLAHEAIFKYLETHSVSEKFNADYKSFIEKTYKNLLKDNKYLVDKTPRYYEIVFEIFKLFPRSKIIIIERNPLDVLASIIQTWNIKSFDELFYYRRDLIFAPLQLRSFINKNNKSKNVKVIRYEDLVTNSEDVLSTTLKWLGLNFENSFLEVTPGNYTFGDPTFDKSTIVSTSVNQWENYLEKNPKWKKFFFGYSYFLSQNGIYGYDLPAKKGTNVFEVFQEYCELRDSDEDNLRMNFRRVKSNLFIKFLNTF